MNRLSWLNLARGVLLALVAASLLAAAVSLLLAPSYVPRHPEAFELTTEWTPELVRAALAQLGWPASTVAWFEYLRGFVLYLGTLVPGLLILRHKSRDWFGLYVAFAFIVVPALTVTQPVEALLPGVKVVGDLAGALAWQFYFVMFYFFPDGRFVPRWARWLLPVWVAMNLTPGAFGGSQSSLFTRYPVLQAIPFALVFIAIGSQVYRYFWRSGGTQRQQTKWVVLALVVTMVCLGWLGPTRSLPAAVSPALSTTLVLEFARLAAVNLGFVIVPAAIAVAILRYRLWDIDVIIRRTLIYSALTALLALAYFGLIVVLESLLRSVTGQSQNQLVIVVSTLGIAALFTPLRGRVQAFIDRRFYRQKYDAARTLAAFGSRLRDEVELDALTEHLVRAVNETMQPASVGLWLNPASTDQRIRTAGGTPISVDPLPHPLTPLPPSGGPVR